MKQHKNRILFFLLFLILNIFIVSWMPRMGFSQGSSEKYPLTKKAYAIIHKDKMADTIPCDIGRGTPVPLANNRTSIGSVRDCEQHIISIDQAINLLEEYNRIMCLGKKTKKHPIAVTWYSPEQLCYEINRLGYPHRLENLKIRIAEQRDYLKKCIEKESKGQKC
ncbi:hypothetical protein ACEWL3_010620 [Sulfitobacter sp. MF3-043]